VQRAIDANDNRHVLEFISDLGLDVVERLTERVDAHHEGMESVLGARGSSQLKELLGTFLVAQRVDN